MAFESWQPIETAPRDGREIILGFADPHGDSFSGYWETRENHWGEVGWQEEGARDGLYISRHPCRPDAWMPFPAPPNCVLQIS